MIATNPSKPYWNTSIAYGSVTDVRDDQTYRTVVLGTQTWLAQNMNYTSLGNSWCYNDSTQNCTLYGRLYNKAAADSACPMGWHLPDTTEWSVLFQYAEMFDTTYPSITYPSKTLENSYWTWYGGHDTLGFSAMAAGVKFIHHNLSVDTTGYWGTWKQALWWTSTVSTDSSSFVYGGAFNSQLWESSLEVNVDGASVRCLKNE